MRRSPYQGPHHPAVISTVRSQSTVRSAHNFCSCVHNMIVLPTPLKAFTDTMPEIKAMLRVCARNLYSWQCDHESVEMINRSLDEWADSESCSDELAAETWRETSSGRCTVNACHQSVG